MSDLAYLNSRETVAHFIETPDKARAEDGIRLSGLAMSRPFFKSYLPTVEPRHAKLFKQRIPHLPLPTLDRRHIDRLSDKLADRLDGEPTMVLASSLSMRWTRERVIAALLDAFARYPDEELRTVTVIKKRWTLKPGELMAVTAKRLKEEFKTDLSRIGVRKMPGPLIAFLHGEFEPTAGVYVLHFHILTTAAKADALKRLIRL